MQRYLVADSSYCCYLLLASTEHSCLIRLISDSRMFFPNESSALGATKSCSVSSLKHLSRHVHRLMVEGRLGKVASVVRGSSDVTQAVGVSRPVCYAAVGLVT